MGVGFGRGGSEPRANGAASNQGGVGATAVNTLSGGNQQKVVVAKWLATAPSILVLDEPAAGIDIGSKSEIVALVRELARKGRAILLISSEMSVLLAACDRIVVLSDGSIVRILPRRQLDPDLRIWRATEASGFAMRSDSFLRRSRLGATMTA